MQKLFGDLTILIFEQAEVMPLYKDGYGIYVNGSFLPESHIHRVNKTSKKLPQRRACSAHMHGTAIYGGRLLNHFGHFLLESLSRLWYTRTDTVSPVIFISGRKELNKFQKAILNVLKIENTIIILKEPTVVSKLIIPSNGYRIQDYFSRYHAEFLACHPYIHEKATRKIWLSRSQLVNCIHKVENEANLERALSKEGWEIIHPQNYSIVEQLDIFATAQTVAGFVGSAFHTLLFIKDFKGKVILFNRIDGGLNKNYLTIAEEKKINQIVVHPKMVKLLSDKQRCDLLMDYSAIYETLDITVINTKKMRSESLISRRINRLLIQTKAATYLQFGCDGDHFINHINVDTKAIVAPRFEIPFKSTESTQYFELCPIDFLLRSMSGKKSYDIIVLTDLNSFEQVYRIFCMTLIGALENTVWVIDDIMPGNLIESLSECVKSGKSRIRKKAKESSQGDIYKFIFVLHDHFPMYSYAVTSGANPQLLVWKAIRPIPPTLPESYTRLTELDYSDLEEHLAILNIKPFNAILRDISSAFNKRVIARSSTKKSLTPTTKSITSK